MSRSFELGLSRLFDCIHSLDVLVSCVGHGHEFNFVSSEDWFSAALVAGRLFVYSPAGKLPRVDIRALCLPCLVLRWYNLFAVSLYRAAERGCSHGSATYFLDFGRGKCGWLLHLQMVRPEWQRQLTLRAPAIRRKSPRGMAVPRGLICAHTDYLLSWLSLVYARAFFLSS